MLKHPAAGLALAMMSLSANAADLGPYGGNQGYAPVPGYARPFSWNGVYLGIQAGYGWANTEALSAPYLGAYNQSYNYSSSGALGGVHGGFNWQFSNIVLGVETDLEASGISGGGTGSLGAGHATSIDWMGSLRGRLGYAMGQTMLYATGGWAYGGVTIDKSANAYATPYVGYSDWRSGWTVGAGIEHAFTSNITARIEYRYTDLGSIDFTSPSAGVADHSSVTSNAVRAGLSFKF